MEELRIKRSDIERIVLYGGRRRRTARQVYDSLEDKPDYIINAGLYDTASGISTCDTIIDGELINGGNYTDHGIAFGADTMRQMSTKLAIDYKVPYFLGGSPTLVQSGCVDIDQKGLTPGFLAAKAVRIGVGFDANDLIICFPEAKCSIYALADKMLDAGCRTAIACDGGGSTSVMQAVDGRLTALNRRTEDRANSTWLLIYLKKGDGDTMPKVMLDAGHGQSDPGAIGPTGLREKDVALEIARRVGSLLGRQGVEVSYTRTDDHRLIDSGTKGQDLSARANKANRDKVDYFVSIHCNSAATTAAHGIETYVIAKGGQAERLANRVQAELIGATGRANRGVKTANFAVLRETNMPAILTEVCFICNPEEEGLLRDSMFLDKAATAIAKGISEHLGIVWQEPADDWREIAIKEVCDRYQLDQSYWLVNVDQPLTVGELFGVLNKVAR